jgi:hypothetical protein
MREETNFRAGGKYCFGQKERKSSYLVEQVRKKFPAKDAAEIQLERWESPNRGFM